LQPTQLKYFEYLFSPLVNSERTELCLLEGKDLNIEISKPVFLLCETLPSFVIPTFCRRFLQFARQPLCSKFAPNTFFLRASLKTLRHLSVLLILKKSQLHTITHDACKPLSEKYFTGKCIYVLCFVLQQFQFEFD
jgi:hypothetical protein